MRELGMLVNDISTNKIVPFLGLDCRFAQTTIPFIVFGKTDNFNTSETAV